MRARYPDQVGGDNIESQFGYCAQSPFGTMLFATRWPFATMVAGVWRTQGYRGHGYAR